MLNYHTDWVQIVLTLCDSKLLNPFPSLFDLGEYALFIILKGLQDTAAFTASDSVASGNRLAVGIISG